MRAFSDEDIKLLIQLQERDSCLDAMKARLAAIPGEILNLRDEFELLKQAAEGKKSALRHLLAGKKERENEIVELENLIRKHQAELNQIKTNEAFKALLGEIEKTRQNKDAVETLVLELLLQIDQETANQKRLERETAESSKTTEQGVKKLEAEKAALENDLKTLSSERETHSSRINPEAVGKYEHIRRERGGLAIVPVKENGDPACGGCNIKLTPHYAVEVKKKGNLVLCDSCQRILFLPSLVNKNVQPAPLPIDSGKI